MELSMLCSMLGTSGSGRISTHATVQSFRKRKRVEETVLYYEMWPRRIQLLPELAWGLKSLHGNQMQKVRPQRFSSSNRKRSLGGV